MSTIVYSRGPCPCIIMLIGESPGETEARIGKPFAGRSGDEQRWYLSRYDLTDHFFYITNLVKEYTPGNPDPTPEQINHWTPHLIDEIRRVRPSLIVPVGAWAARWFIGDGAHLEDIHGMPHKGGELDPTRANRSHGAVILPIYHPAYGFYSPEMKTVINQDYGQLAHYLKLVKANLAHTINYRVDPYAGSEIYLDVTGEELADLISSDRPTAIGLDTEGYLYDQWSAQVSTMPGTGYVLRCKQADLSIGIRRLQELVDDNCLVVTHDAGTPEGTLYDTQMCRKMGLELTDAKMFNTMYAAYILRTESKSLKTLAYRHCGMVMEDYSSLVDGIARDKQVAYLREVLRHNWPKPETRLIRENDGTKRNYTPKSIASFAAAIIRDVESGKVNKEGELTDPYERWTGAKSGSRKSAAKANKGADKVVRKLIESQLGPMPYATLDDVQPLERAIGYAGRDPDACLRLIDPLTDLMKRG